MPKQEEPRCIPNLAGYRVPFVTAASSRPGHPDRVAHIGRNRQRHRYLAGIVRNVAGIRQGPLGRPGNDLPA